MLPCRRSGGDLADEAALVAVVLVVVACCGVLYGLAAMAEAALARRSGRMPRISPSASGLRLRHLLVSLSSLFFASFLAHLRYLRWRTTMAFYAALLIDRRPRRRRALDRRRRDS